MIERQVYAMQKEFNTDLRAFIPDMPTAPNIMKELVESKEFEMISCNLQSLNEIMVGQPNNKNHYTPHQL